MPQNVFDVALHIWRNLKLQNKSFRNVVYEASPNDGSKVSLDE